MGQTVKNKKSKSASASSRSKRRNRKREGFRFFRFLSSIPAWGIWLGAILIAFAYVFFFYYFFVDPYSFRWKAIYGKPQYPEGYDIRGIDISHYQEQINWQKLRNANINNDPVRFIIIKATEGVSLMDDNFNENFYQARANDFIRGAYHFYVPGLNVDKQARFYLHQVHLEPGDFPPILDVEKIGSETPQQLKKNVLRWLTIVANHYKVKPILYTSYKFKTQYLDDEVFNQYPYWIAHYYVSELRYKGEWAIWQHTDCGELDGIRGKVDLNIFNGSEAELHQFTIQEDDDEELLELEAEEADAP